MAPGRSFLRPVLWAVFTALCCPVQAADWPGWRGLARDGHSAEPFPTAFPPDLKPRWRTPLAHGYASPVITGTTLLVLDDAGGQETARALDATTGKERWQTPYAKAWSDEFEPGPRCTPLIDGDQVYVQSAQGEVACLGLQDGRKRWGVRFADLGMVWVSERHSNVGASVRRGHTGSPVVAGERVLLQVGSTEGAAVAAFDRKTGKLLWKALNDATCYSSPMIGRLAGREQWVTATCEGLVGVDVTDGTALWRVPFRTGANRNVLTPILDGDSILFASHTTGMRRVKIQGAAPQQEAKEEWLNRKLGINLATPVLVDGHLYGLGPAKQFVCVSAATGEIRWSQPGYGDCAAVIAAGGRLLVQLDTGEIRLLRVNAERYEELGQFQACGKTYSHPAWSAGVLYVRDPAGCAAYPLATTAAAGR
jgi:outer membrane protein assembly factor BamB